MRKRIRPDEAFEQRLQGQLPEASEPLDRLAKLAEALRPADRPAGPGPQFRTRLRSELLARASAQESDEAELFAAMLEGEPVSLSLDMKPLVAVASALKPEHLPSPAPAFRYQLRRRLVTAATPQPFLLARAGARIAGWNTRMRRSARLVGATGLAVLMMLGAGASLAGSRNAVRGDLLYPVKRFHESAQLIGTTGEERATKLFGFARTRLRELNTLVERGERSSEPFIGTLNDMDAHTIEGRDIVVDVYRATRKLSLLQDLEAFAREQAADLSVLVDRLPPAARPVAMDSLTLVDSIAKQTLAALEVACSICPDGFSDPVRVTGGPSEGSEVIGCACEQPSGSTDGGQTTDAGDGGDGGDGGGGTDPPDDTEPPVDDKRIDIDDPTGTGIDEPIEQVIDELLDGIDDVSPTPLPSVSPLPLAPTQLPSVSALPSL